MASIRKKESLHQRMKAIRAAAGHRDLRPAERSLLVILVTYQNFKEDPTFGSGWMVSRRRLAEDYYGRADKTALRNLDRLIAALYDEGFITILGTGRNANTYVVNFDRLSAQQTGQAHRPQAVRADRAEAVQQTGPQRLDAPTISTSFSAFAAETTSLPSSDPARPGKEDQGEIVVTPEIMELVKLFGITPTDDDADSYLPALVALDSLKHELIDLYGHTVHEVDQFLWNLARTFPRDPAAAASELQRLCA